MSPEVSQKKGDCGVSAYSIGGSDHSDPVHAEQQGIET